MTAEQLLGDPFFGPELHAAHAFLRNNLYDTTTITATITTTIHSPAQSATTTIATPASAQPAWGELLPAPPPWHLPQQLASLAHAARTGALDRLADQPPALELCLPHVMHLQWQLAVVACARGGTGSSALAGWVRAAGAKPGAGMECVAEQGQQLLAHMSGHTLEVLQALLRLLPPNLATSHVLPYVCYCLSYFLDVDDQRPHMSEHEQQLLLQQRTGGSAAEAAHEGGGAGGSAAAAAGAIPALSYKVLSPALHMQLLAATDLDAYVQRALPLLLAALLCPASAAVAPGSASEAHGRPAAAASAAAAGPGVLASSPLPSVTSAGGVSRALAGSSGVSDAAATALVALAPRLPLPLLLERVLSPAVACVTAGASVQRLLVRLCTEMGGQLAARHVAPVLLHMAIVPSAGTTSGGGSRERAGGARRASGPVAASGRAQQEAAAAGNTAAGQAGGFGGGGGDAAVHNQIYAALSVLGAILDLLPPELIPRAFLHGLAPQYPAGAQPPSPSAVQSGGTGGGPPAASPASSGAGLTSFGSAEGPAAQRARISSSGSSGGGGSPAVPLPPLLSVLLDPGSYVVAPGSLTLLAGLALRAFVRLARPENLAWVVLPHVMPLLSNAGPRRRAAYRANGTAASQRQQREQLAAVGSGGGGGGGVAGGANDDEEGGYWELVQCVYG